MNFQRVVADSGLAKTELAKLYGVSRQTIHAWADGRGPSEGTYIAWRAETYTQALEGAIDKGVLPFGELRPRVRAERVKRMAATLQSLKPAPK